MAGSTSSMPDIALMIEGQAGLTWDRWRRLAATVADRGFSGLFRSDHFTTAEGPLEDSLGLWPSLTWLADNTDDIAFGPLVSPVSFRHPVHTARMARDVDDLAGGRLVLGVGAGWQEREHETYGFDLLPVTERFDRYEEGLEVITSLLRSDEPVTFDGEYFQLDEATLRPRPTSTGGPEVLVGGNGRKRTIPLAARYADEWNGVYLPVEEYESRIDRLEEALAEEGRDPDAVRRSLMTRVVFGRDETEVDSLLGDQDRSELREMGVLVGTADDVTEQLEAVGEAGASRVMLQWLEQDDIDRLSAFADAVF